MIELLQKLQQDSDQHFHISSDYTGEPGLGDIEISTAGESEQDNMWLSGPAIAPGADMPAADA